MADIVIDGSSGADIEVSGGASQTIETGLQQGGAVWGRIIGDMADQRDLTQRLDKIEKYAKAAMVM